MDVVGKKIHELTILKRVRKNGRIHYKVKCSCGKIFTTRKDSITSGKTKSCGHLTQFKSRDLIGRKFGRLKVVKKKDINKEGRQLWECICDCGNKHVADTTLLTSGKAKSCGCLFNEMLEDSQEKYQDKITRNYRKEDTYIPALKMKTPSTNISGVKGVHWDGFRSKWRAQIQFQGKNIFLGRFDKKEDAITAREEAEKKYFKPIIEKYKNKDTEKE